MKKTNEQARDDFWTSIGIMQGGKAPSVKTKRLKDLADGKITPKEATPDGETTMGLLIKGAAIYRKTD